MDPREMNVLITSLTNYFYTNLDRYEFNCLSVFLNELSKSMFATALFRDLCEKGKHKDKGKDGKDDKGDKDGKDTDPDDKK